MLPGMSAPTQLAPSSHGLKPALTPPSEGASSISLITSLARLRIAGKSADALRWLNWSGEGKGFGEGGKSSGGGGCEGSGVWDRSGFPPGGVGFVMCACGRLVGEASTWWREGWTGGGEEDERGEVPIQKAEVTWVPGIRTAAGRKEEHCLAKEWKTLYAFTSPPPT